MTKSPRIFLAVPSYEGRVYSRAAQTIYTASTIHPKIECGPSSSLLCHAFNTAWCMALNMRDQGITHFAMLHDDIQPAEGWIDTLLEEMDKADADIVSTVVPLKNNTGLTSTAINTDTWRPRRLTMREVAKLPETFGASDVPWNKDRGCLLINTGCWICRFTDPWIERVCFNIADRIVKVNGRFEPFVAPEDWSFSRFAHREDLSVFATTKVRLTHVGAAQFQNWGEWGQESDEANTAAARLSPADNGETRRRDTVAVRTMCP